MLKLPYERVYAIDTEYNFRPSPAYAYPNDPQPEGSLQHPVCLVARELYSGQKIELFEDEFGPEPPFSVGPENLFVAYNAPAEWLTFLALGWPLPARVLDLYVEFRRHICGTPRDINVKGNKTLLAAKKHFGIRGMTAEQKDEERALVLRGGPWTAAKRRRVIRYCDSDVRPLFRLAEHLLNKDCCGEPLRSHPAGLAQAVHRGRYTLAVARMEHAGISVDNDTLGRVLTHWEAIRAAIIAELDVFGVYVDGHWSNARFLDIVDGLGIHWPCTATGLPKLKDDEVFKDMAVRYPRLNPIRQLRNQLAELHLERLQIGADGRNRTGMGMFVSKSGRNQPRSSKYIFGLPKWVRHLLKPPPGWALAYLDYRSQEYHIAGVLSGDAELLAMLAAPDPYMALAVMMGLAPPGATKQSHPEIRAVCKVLLLGSNYGMGVETFALKANIPLIRAEHIHGQLKHTFTTYHKWSSKVVREARAGHWLHTVFGWRQWMDNSGPLTIRNWKMQAGGAEMIRLACCLATERGVTVCGPIHDALLIQAPADQIDTAVAAARAAMEEASREVLDGYTIPVDAEIVQWPNRYQPEEGGVMWERVLRLVNLLEDARRGLTV